MQQDIWDVDIACLTDVSYNGWNFAIFLVKISVNAGNLQATNELSTGLTWAVYPWYFDAVVSGSFKYATRVRTNPVGHVGITFQVS